MFEKIGKALDAATKIDNLMAEVNKGKEWVKAHKNQIKTGAIVVGALALDLAFRPTRRDVHYHIHYHIS